jgi:hypothetical protein
LALSRADVRVIPVLVGGADMPKVSDLPDPLKDLVYRNAAVIEDRRFASDVRTLQNALKQFVKQTTGDQVPTTSANGDHRQQATSAAPQHPAPRSTAKSVSHAGGSLTARTVLAVLGGAVVLVSGVVLRPGWHDELWVIRAAASLALVMLTAVGLWSRQWRWVLFAGIAGLAGLAIWLIYLVSTHPDEIYEIFGPSYDGIPNLVTLTGAVAVLIAGRMGMRATASSP